MKSAVHLTAREDGERGGYPDNPRPPRRNDDGFPRFSFAATQPFASPASGGVVDTGTSSAPALGAVSISTAPPPPETGGHLGAGLAPPDGSAPLSFIYQPSPRDKAEHLYDALVRLRDQARQMHRPSKELSRCVELAGARLIALQITGDTHAA